QGEGLDRHARSERRTGRRVSRERSRRAISRRAVRRMTIPRRDFVAAVPAAGLWLNETRPTASVPVDSDLLFGSLRRLARLVRDKQVSASELVRLHLDRIAVVNPKLNAVVQLAVDRARSEAAALDRDRSKGVVRGPLHGVPITIKDSLETAGIVSTAG